MVTARQAPVKSARRGTAWIVPLAGLVGLMLVAAQCYDQPVVIRGFAVFPVSGEAPLEVSASFILNDAAITAADCTIDFGDSSQVVTILDCLDFTETVEHVYVGPGEYTVRLQVRTNLLADPISARAQREVTVFEPGTARELVVELVSVDGGTGKVVSDGGDIECSNSTAPGFPAAACSALFLVGAQVELSAIPAPGSTFVGWDGDGTGTTTRLVVMDDDKAVTATFRGEDPDPEPNNKITVEVVDGFGDWLEPQVLAVQTGTGGWSTLEASETGRYAFVLPEGDATYAVTVRCDDGQIKTFLLTPEETTSLVVPCPSPTTVPDPVSYAVSYSGMGELGSGSTYLGRLYGPTGQIGIGSGEASGFTVANQPSTPHDIILTGDIDGDRLGAKIERDFVPFQNALVSFEFTAADRATAATLNPYTAPVGFSSLLDVIFCSEGGTCITVGSGDQAGGSYATLPFAADGDLYAADAFAQGGIAYVRDAQVFVAAELQTVEFVPPWDAFVGPTPAAFPTFTGLNHLSEHPELRGYAVLLAWQSQGGANRVWRHFVGETYLSLTVEDASFSTPDLTGVSGLEDLEPRAAVSYAVGAVLLDTEVEEFLSYRGPSTFIPLLGGLRLREAGVLGGFQVP